jgi:hypothetical protein
MNWRGCSPKLPGEAEETLEKPSHPIHYSYILNGIHEHRHHITCYGTLKKGIYMGLNFYSLMRRSCTVRSMKAETRQQGTAL